VPKTYLLRQQDCLSSIAIQHGLTAATIWNDPANDSLRHIRKNYNILLPGDELVIPDMRKGEVSAATEQKHTFRRHGVPDKLRITLLDDEGEPRKKLRYTIVIDGHTTDGVTDETGTVEITISPKAKTGKLRIGEGEDEEVFVLSLGGIDPINTLSGAQQRLHNLGYCCERIDGVNDEKTEITIQEFQSEHEMEVTGSYDDATQDKLEELYGC